MGSLMLEDDYTDQLHENTSQPQFILIAKSNSTDCDTVFNIVEDSGMSAALADKITDDELVKMAEEPGEVRSDILLLLDTLGNSCFENEDYDEALQYYRKALELRIHSLGKQHPDIGDTLSSIGSVLKQKNLPDESLNAFKAAIEIYQGHIDTSEDILTLQIKIVNVINGAGSIYFEKRELDTALMSYEEALSMARQTRDSESIADSCSNIASVYAEKGNQALAIEYYNEALERQVELYGEDDPRVANVLNNLGTLYFRSENFTFAMKSYKQVLKMRRNILGHDHVSISDIMVHIALVHERQNNSARAEQIYDEALRIAMNELGKENLRVANIKSRLGNIHERNDRDNSAEIYYNSALDIYKLNGLEKDHHLVQHVAQRLNELEKKRGNDLVEMFSCFGDPLAMVFGEKPGNAGANRSLLHIF